MIAGTWTILVANFRRVTQASWALIWLTMVHLFAICLAPWVTAFLAQNPTLPQVVSMYGLLGTLIMGTSAAISRRIEIDYPTAYEWSLRRDMVFIGIWAISIPLAFVTVYLSFVIFVVIPLLAFVPKRSHEETLLTHCSSVVQFNQMTMTPNLSLNPDASPAALARPPLGAG